MSGWIASLFVEQLEEKRSDPRMIEARMRANFIIERLSAALGVAATDHPVKEVDQIPTRFISYGDYYVDVYLEIERAGLALPTGSWELIISGKEVTAVQTFQGMDLLLAINHILRFTRSKKYRARWME
ncbi:MAG TPA: hypothetical protein VE999_07840 [Gemmataceae bacterium]|nr:hypothetical protein [Gemmataceae bacterium]